jgi:hypothetical protein
MADDADTTTVAEPKAEPKTDVTTTTPVDPKPPEKPDESSLVTAPPKKETPEAPKPPEKYDLKLPEDSLLDEGAIERTAAQAKEQGLSNDAAQELLERQSQAVSDHVEKQSEAWRAEVKADKEIGGDNYNESVEMSRRLVDHYGSDALKRELNRSRFGDNPEVVRFCTRIAKDLKMGEDKMVVAPTPTGGKPKTAADTLYSKTKTEE